MSKRRPKYRILEILFALTALVTGSLARADDCSGDFVPTLEFFKKKIEAFRAIDKNFETAFPDLDAEKLNSMQVLRKYILVGDRFLSKRLVTVFIGAENMGKSTTVAGLGPLLTGRSEAHPEDYVTKPFHSGGATVRPVIVMSPRPLDDESIADITARYGDVDFDQDPEAALRPGKPLVRFVEGLAQYHDFIFVDAPDFTSGEVGATPTNLEAARKALLPGDIIYVMVDDRNSKNQAVQQILYDNFQMYGARRTAWIMRSGIFYQRNPDQAVDLLTKTARQAYFGPKADQHVGRPAELSGMFLMPDEPAVALMESHPSYTPIGGTPEFSGLLDDHSLNWAQIKDVAIKSATQKVQEDLGGVVVREDRAQLAAEIYYATAKAVGTEIAKSSTQDFPYDNNTQLWRQTFAKTGKLAWVDHILEKTFGQYQKIPFFLSQKDDVLKMNADLQNAALARTRVQVEKYWSDLARGRLTLSPGPEVDHVLTLIKLYDQKFPTENLNAEIKSIVGPKVNAIGERNGDDEVTSISFTLPNPDVLKGPVRAAWRKTLDMASAFVASDMVNQPLSDNEKVRINHLESRAGTLTKAETAELKDLKTTYRAKLKMVEVDQGMIQARDKMPVRKKIATGLSDAGGPTGGLVAGGFTVFKAAAVTLTTWMSGGGVLVAVGGATGVVGRWNSDRVVNHNLKPLIDEWFKAYQQAELIKGFEDYVMKELNGTRAENAKQSDAFGKIVDALRVLGTSEPE